MASRVLQTAKNNNSLRDPRHLLRFLKSQVPGVSLESIAKSEGVSLATVKHSVTMVEAYRQMNSTLEMDLAIRNLVIEAVPKAKETLVGLLGAMEMVEVTNPKTGKKEIKQVEDKTTRLEATRVVNSLIIGLQPKTPTVVNNVNQTNQVANLSTAETMEERLERLRKKAQEANQLPAEVVGVPDYIDKDEEPPSADDEDEEEEE